MTKNPLDLSALRARMEGARGREYWRSLEELAETPEFRDFLEQEFPQHAEDWAGPVNRRRILQVMGASFAFAGLTACSPPLRKIVPYVTAPEQVVPGKPLFFATAITQGGVASGLLVESNMGRPTKIEGNPDHPASLGSTDAITQASLLTLYDPDRSQVAMHLGNISSWVSLLATLSAGREAMKASQGEGLRILTETVTSPTLADQLNALLKEYPKAQWHQFEPVNGDHLRAGSQMAFGEVVNTHYNFAQADLILSLDSNFLFSGPGALRYTREFAARRRAAAEPGGNTEMNRLYVVETMPSSTGAMADHRLALKAGDMEAFAHSIAMALGAEKPAAGRAAPSQPAWASAVVRDLEKHRGHSIVLAGPEQSAATHALCHKINHALGNAGQTVIHTAPLEPNPVDQNKSLRDLVADIEAQKVSTLVILGANPAYTAPEDLHFAQMLRTVRLSFHLGLYQDETAELCNWHIPEAHYLESWGDARAYDGTVSIVQPLIAPLYNGKTAHEVLAALVGRPRQGYDIVRDYWKGQKLSGEFEAVWRKSLHDGLVASTALPPKQVTVKTDPLPETPPAPAGLELVFRPDPNIGDGRYANNGWLQELPKPVTKITWDNAAFISPATAQGLGLQNSDLVDLKLGSRAVQAPVWILPGHAKDSVTVHLGYGRRRAGNVGDRIGFNAYALRTSPAAWFSNDLKVSPAASTSEPHTLVTTQEHHSMEGRDLIRAGEWEEFRKKPNFLEEAEKNPANDLTFYPEHKHEGYGWGMSIDLNSCVGCNACVVACQSENNSPVVGKEQVAVHREMQWLRIDRYYEGSLDDPETLFQPVMCQHCEDAPCEVVCPVAATTHSPEGLNEMVYNRCVGTRYCSNNCPYKVRRFNFLAYSDWTTPSLQLMRNPNVTVRSRGVMEKCTYCVQRINRAKIEAEKESPPREVRDGEIVTACQAVCPAQAIVFGNIKDPQSMVSRNKAHPLSYLLLGELGTRPRTSYLARLRNPNPEIPKAPAKKEGA